MAPSAVDNVQQAVDQVTEKVLSTKLDNTGTPSNGNKTTSQLKNEEHPNLETGHKEPLKLSGALDYLEAFDVTPVIGREYVNANLVELLEAPNSDELIRDLAITTERTTAKTMRSVLSPQSKPRRSTRTASAASVSCLVTAKAPRISGTATSPLSRSPPNYALLKLTQLPKTGGDTLWASGYEVYDRISPTLRSFLETLTGYYAQPGFNDAADRNGFKLYSAERGAPENVGEVLEAIHPVIRTNPVTGWKSVFAVGHHVKRINGLSEAESKHFLNWFVQLIVENHDLQVRFKWKAVNDVAIWDNRSVYHTATTDYLFEEGLGERKGSRAVSLGEKPYIDPQSSSRREALLREGSAGSA
ncbi:hypothetical protein GE09DRAFT_1160932 [Coniochaeta sp. 2T2.1]|nr:hypothetical protein GE09DRAFT_1160932 [Coniochaeta sp. 2T2.1]